METKVAEANTIVFFLGILSLKSDTKENFRDRFPISEWMKLLK
jgi:hypothetical protein